MTYSACLFYYHDVSAIAVIASVISSESTIVGYCGVASFFQLFPRGSDVLPLLLVATRKDLAISILFEFSYFASSLASFLVEHRRSLLVFPVWRRCHSF